MRYELSDYEWTAIKPMLPDRVLPTHIWTGSAEDPVHLFIDPIRAAVSRHAAFCCVSAHFPSPDCTWQSVSWCTRMMAQCGGE
jgi:hypothetical protein